MKLIEKGANVFMSKGLEKIELLKSLANDGRIAYDIAKYNEWLKIIEKELEEAEENKKMLDIFKNALTVEYKPFSIEMQQESKDFVSLLCKNIATIRENELDKNLREILKKWVLKNAFPKELKVLEIIREKKVNILTLLQCCYDIGKYNAKCSKLQSMLTLDEINLLKEVLV